jgi:hypothetical protein
VAIPASEARSTSSDKILQQIRGDIDKRIRAELDDKKTEKLGERAKEIVGINGGL